MHPYKYHHQQLPNNRSQLSEHSSSYTFVNIFFLCRIFIAALNETTRNGAPLHCSLFSIYNKTARNAMNPRDTIPNAQRKVGVKQTRTTSQAN